MTRRLSSRRTGELDPRLAWLLMMLYPRAWRDRYGAEVLRLTRELIAAGETTPARAAVNLACAAFAERCRALGHAWRPAIAVSVAALLALAAGLSVTSHVHRAASAGAASASAPPPRRAWSGSCARSRVRRRGSRRSRPSGPGRRSSSSCRAMAPAACASNCVPTAPDKAGTSGP
jgi:hypothetical protein